MKKILTIVGLAFLTLFIVSCEKETEGISRETHYAVFELTGGSLYQLQIGTPYIEPGVVAKAGDAVLEVESSNDIDYTALGVYTVQYSAVNSDGFSASTQRTVVVYDPTSPLTDISGKYSAGVVRTEADYSSPRPRTGEVNISKLAPGIFSVDCLLGGFYSIGSGYGSSYAMTGYIVLKSDNKLGLLSSYVSGWGDGLQDFFDGSYDPATGKIVWKSVYASGDIFSVTLNLE